MNTVREFAHPVSLQAAVELLARAMPVARPLAGGTAIALAGTDAQVLVDLAGLGLGSIVRTGAVLSVGAMTTLQELADAEAVCAELRHALKHEAPRNIRNQATLGGTLATAKGGPLLACLVALGAHLHVEPGSQDVTLASYYYARRQAGTPAGRLIVSLGYSVARRIGYAEIARTPADAPILCVAAGADVVAGRLANVQLACSGAGQLLAIGTEHAARLEGLPVSEAADTAARVAAEWTVAWGDDARGQASYRQSMQPVLVRRAISNLLAQA